MTFSCGEYMEETHTVYGLVDPRSGHVRYVGKTRASLRERLVQHMTPSRLVARTVKNGWVKRLLSLGLAPQIVCIEEFDTDHECNEGEVFYIAHLRSVGAALVNGTDGGEGGRTRANWHHTDEAKSILSAKAKMRRLSAETRAKIGAAGRGKPRPKSPETRRKISEARKRQPPPMLGRKLSAEVCRRMSEARLGVPNPKLWREVVASDGRRFPSLAMAGEALGVTRSAISQALKRQRPIRGVTLNYGQE